MTPYFKLEAGAQLDPLKVIQACLENRLKGVLLLEVDLPIELFDLSSGLLGELLHQLSKYRIPLALVIEDPAHYSDPFQAFLHEANRRGEVRIFSAYQDAVRWLQGRKEPKTAFSNPMEVKQPSASPRIHLKTPRLDLRTAGLKDLERVVQTWDPNGKTIPREQAERQILWMTANHRELAARNLTHLCLAVIHRETGTWVGWCGLDNREKIKERPALFYRIHKEHRSRGFATEAARAVLDYALTELDLPEVQARTRPGNPASRRVLEKLGMRSPGKTGDGGSLDSLTREDFLHNRGFQGGR